MKRPKYAHTNPHFHADKSLDSELNNQLPEPNFPFLTSTLFEQREYLLNLLLALDGVVQSPKYHPESDALYHSLQVFEWSYKEANDPELWLAALFHDVGKSVDAKYHCEIGSEMLTGFFPKRVTWLIEHHLDLMRTPRTTKRKHQNSKRLKDLFLLRRWDLAGRQRMVNVREPDEALEIILNKLKKTTIYSA